MVTAQRHESFYTCDTWKDEEMRVYVGWTDHRNSFSDGMPLTNERQDVSLIFRRGVSGTSSAQRLKQQGHYSVTRGAEPTEAAKMSWWPVKWPMLANNPTRWSP
jgi:hypothetical protein